MTAPTPWEACGNVIRDADSIEVCTVPVLWHDKPAEVAARIVAAVNAHAGRNPDTATTQPAACIDIQGPEDTASVDFGAIAERVARGEGQR